MKTLWELMSWVSDKQRFETIVDYVEFAKYYLGIYRNRVTGEVGS